MSLRAQWMIGQILILMIQAGTAEKQALGLTAPVAAINP